jgi:isoleucyl-tRNA synthetase
MSFCLAAEEFVDAKLSNWYIRVNRDRFWSNTAKLDEAGKRDKLAAYQTLYAVMTDLCRLLAPVVPFLAEVMWQNLRLPTWAESVHLTDYPQPDEALVDEALSQDMNAVLRVVSFGLYTRQQVAQAKVNVRQPLSEFVVYPGSDADKRAVERFPNLIRDELNVKRVRLQREPLLVPRGLNKKAAASKLGAKLRSVEAELAKMNPGEVAARLQKGPIEMFGVVLESSDFEMSLNMEGSWGAVEDKGTQVAINLHITEELRLEGLAREVIRLVQAARKDAKLDVADKIALYLDTKSTTVQTAIAAHRAYIAAETQATQWSDAPLNGEAFSPAEPRKVDGQVLTIALRKV